MRTSYKWILKNRYQNAADEIKGRIFLFHHAGGTAAFYRNWEVLFDHSLEVCPVQLPMRANRMQECMPDEIPEMVKSFIDESLDLFDLPVILFGHSMGAKIAYEAAFQLTGRQIPVLGLYVSACESPEYQDLNPSYRPFQSMQEADDQTLINILKSYDHMLDEEALADQEFLDYYMPIVRKDFYVSDSYYKEENYTLCCDIVSLIGSEDSHLDAAACLKWKHYTTGAFSHHVFPGDHFYLEQQENKKKISDMINAKFVSERCKWH